MQTVLRRKHTKGLELNWKIPKACQVKYRIPILNYPRLWFLQALQWVTAHLGNVEKWGEKKIRIKAKK